MSANTQTASPVQTLPPLPEAKEVSSLLPDGFGLDILRNAKIVPLRVEDGVLIVGAVDFDAWNKAQMLGTALGFPIDLEIREEKEISDLLRTLYDLRSVAADEAAKNIEGIDDIDDLTREDVLSSVLTFSFTQASSRSSIFQYLPVKSTIGRGPKSLVCM